MGRCSLLVEGTDDQHVLWALLVAHAVPETFKIEPVGGVSRLLENLRVRLKLRSDRSLGIMLDADVDLDARWRSLRDRVHELHADVLPAVPAPDGTVVDLPGGRKLGIWLMPDNRLPGILEDFVAALVPPDDECWPLACDYVDGLKGDTQRFAAPRRAKARLHAWLAVQAEPGRPIGQAITARYLDANSTVASSLLRWLRRLFVSPQTA